MMSALLPIKESVRALILEVAGALQPHFADITAAWRKRMFEEFQFDGRAMTALERLNLGTGFALFGHSDFAAFSENLDYHGTRLAKLQVDTRAVARSLELYLELCALYVHRLFGERRFEVMAALEMLSSASFVAISGAYFDTQKAASDALLAVLDAELSARNLSALLERVLQITTKIFGATAGIVLLLDQETNQLHVKQVVGLETALDADLSIAMGQGFSGQIAASGEPAILADLTQSHGVLNPYLRPVARSLWGVPLKNGDQVIGVVLIGFGKLYDWLPRERELLRAIADRSALAIDRAGMTDALREREMRIAELSGYLLRAQEEERKRISRELHDETGQALMVIRLYLGMLEKNVGTRTARAKIHETLDVVDRTIEGIRRIIGRLSPLVLQELGMIAAIRKEAKDLAKGTGVKARVSVSEDIGRLAPEIEIAIYRAVQEALHNVAKHAEAKSVNIQMAREEGAVRLVIEDDGVGINPVQNPGRRSFGLAGMRERICTLGGTMRVTSRKNQGTRIAISVPIPQHGNLQELPKGTAMPIGHAGAMPLVGTGTTD
ncbi:MAG TPA: GAF domain-containing sensor histidine kinase [Clostridia bacterium]|nr:GAF domain-containing sensor histidine kinase [Clostridia bacterium]